MDVRLHGPSRTILLTLGLLAASAAGVPAYAPLPAQEAERDVRLERDCRCVDGEGEAIENCRCFRMPDVARIREQARAWTLPARGGAWLGVTVEAARDEDDESRGVHLREVMEDSPAWEAGLRSGDLVVAVDGTSVLEALPDDEVERRPRPGGPGSPPVRRFLTLVRDLEPGEEIRVDYRRDGEARVALVTPEDHPGPGVLRLDGHAPRMARVFSYRGDGPPRPGFMADPCFTDHGPDRGFRLFGAADCVDGLHLQELNPELGAYFGGEDGVLVTEVSGDASLGLESGDVILRIDEREVREPEEVGRILRSYGVDEEITLTVRRRGEVVQVLGTRRPPE